MANVLVDSNVLVRHLLQDHEQHSPAATALLGRIERGDLNASLSALAVAEAVWVLQGRIYGLDRQTIRDGLSQLVLMPNLDVPERDHIVRALELYARHRIDLADAYHAALALTMGTDVCSFDHDFDRVPGIRRIDPLDVASI